MSAICRRSWRSMSAISTTGARIVPSDNARPARPRHGLIEVLKLEGSPRYELCALEDETHVDNDLVKHIRKDCSVALPAVAKSRIGQIAGILSRAVRVVKCAAQLT